MTKLNEKNSKIVAAISKEVVNNLIIDLWKGIYKYSISEGFELNEMYEYFFVDLNTQPKRIECEVRAGLSYCELNTLCEELDPIVQKYDPYAYFEPVEPGIITAYIYIRDKLKGDTKLNVRNSILINDNPELFYTEQ